MKSQSKKRQEILLLLKKNESLTFGEMMAHFTISEPALRNHIRHLEREAFVEKKAHKQKIGRPFYTYYLTKAGHQLFSNQDERLPLQILADIEELYGEKAVNTILKKRMEREKDTYEPTCCSDKDLEEKIEGIVRIQNENGYMAEICRHEDGKIEIMNYHCPIYDLASKYGQLCTNEKKMYEQLFPDRSIRIDSKIAAGDHVCKWVIAPKHN